MPRVYRRTWVRAGATHESPWYHLSYIGPDGRKVDRRTRPPTSSAKEARAQLAKAMARAHEEHEQPELRLTVQDVLDTYEKHLELHSPSHWASTGRAVLRAWGEAYGNRRALDLRMADVEAFTGRLEKLGRAEATILNYLAPLRAAFRRAVRDGRLPGHPLTTMTTRYRVAERHVVWTDEELAAVSAHLPSWGQGVVALLRLTGLRVGDALALRWDSVQGQPPEALRLRLGKTRRWADLPVSPEASCLLGAFPRESGASWVFPCPGTDGPWSRSQFRHRFARACRAAGVSGKTIHDIRRTYATRAWNAGVPPALVARLLGQHGTRLVRRYTHAEVDTMRAAATLATQATATRASRVPPVLPNAAESMRSDADFGVAAAGLAEFDPSI